MRSISVFAILLFTTLAAPALADGEPDNATVSKPAEEPKLDILFDKLKREPKPQAAKLIADQIWAEWRDSGSATINLLMQWSDEAVADNRPTTALDILDQVIVLKPDYAEGWNRRATLHYVRGNFAKSMSDIKHVLALEPRHFGALSGMAAILGAEGKDRLAMDALQKALDVYPANRDAQKKIGELADKLTGDAI